MRVEYTLSNGDTLIVREAGADDASSILDYLDVVCAETDYLSFGPGEFDLTLEEETSYLEQTREADNRLYVVATVDEVDRAGVLGEVVGFLDGRVAPADDGQRFVAETG